MKKYDAVINDAIESFVEENYEEGTIECKADVLDKMHSDPIFANDVFNRALEYLKMSLINEDDFKQWFNDTIM